jgi:DNA-binding transcriptional ArsR family regulator
MNDSRTPRRVSSKRLVNEKLAAIADPLRLAVITTLSRAPASGSQLAAALDEEPARIRYILRRMREVGLVDVAGSTTHQGVRENLYRVQPARFVLTDEEAAGIAPYEIDRAMAALVRLMFRESSAVMKSTPNLAREEFAMRFPLPLDRQGWAEAAALHQEAMRKVMEVGERSLERLDASGEDPLVSLAMVLFFPLVSGAGGDPPSAEGRP